MDSEKVEFWTYGCENGNIMIYFEANKRYIEVSPKDVRSMYSWILMDTGKYRPDWDKELI